MAFSGQFIDNITFVDPTGSKLLVYKYTRPGDEIKQGANLMVRNGQAAVFVHEGQIADVFGPGRYRLETGNLPILSTLAAFKYAFDSPIKSDVYFVNTTQFINNKWGTKSPIVKRDTELGVCRITSFGTFAFKIADVEFFMNEVFGARNLNMTYDIIQYLCSYIGEAIAQSLGDIDMSVIDLAGHYRELSGYVTDYVNDRAKNLGIEVTEATIQNIGLPPAVEKLIDEQSGIGMASRDMNSFMQYQSARAMRDAAQQPAGMAGLGASFVIGNQMAQSMAAGLTPQTETSAKAKETKEKTTPAVSIADTLMKYKELLDNDILTQEEFNELKANLLKEL